MVRWSCIALFALGGCAAPITEVVVQVDSDFDVPSELSAIEIEVTSPDDVTQTAMADLGGMEAELPRTLSLVQEAAPLGPYRVRVTGFRRGMMLLRRDAEFTFVRDESRLLRLDLEQACESVRCNGNETCEAGDCRDRDVTADELQPL